MALNREILRPESPSPNPSDRARAVASPNARFNIGNASRPVPGAVRPAPKPKAPMGNLPTVDKKMSLGINKRVQNRTARFMASHPNATPEGLAKRQAKWTAGTTRRHQMRRALSNLKGSPLAGGAPIDRPGIPRAGDGGPPTKTSPGRSATPPMFNKRGGY